MRERGGMAYTVASKATGLRPMRVQVPPLPPKTMPTETIATEQPTWVCYKCAEKYGAWLKEHKTLPIAEYHTSMCDVCLRHDVGVTRPQNFGLLVEGWNR